MFAATRIWRLIVCSAVTLCVATWEPVLACDDDPDARDGSGAAASDQVTDAVERGINFLNTDLVNGALVSNDRVWLLADRSSSIGVDVTPISAALRSQLGLTDDRGVNVTNVETEGPGAQAGIQVHDVLLTAGGKPVNSAAALQESIDATGEEAIPIILMRGGKRMSVEVTPSGPDSVWVDSLVRSYWIGITADVADDALRTQLALPEGRGLVVTEVYDESAAAAAGIEVHDVLLEFEDVPLSSVEELNGRIQEVGDEAATMKLIRGGDELILKVTPRAREGGDGMLWVYDTSRSVQNLAELTARYAGMNAYNLPMNRPMYTVNGFGNEEVELDVLSRMSGWSGGIGIYPDHLETETVEQQLQSLVEEARALTERMRALEESIRSETGEETQPESVEGAAGESE